MNILLVTHNYAPDTSPRAYRWTAIAEAWADRGFHVDVVTSGRQKDQSPVGQTGVHVHRVGERIIGRLRRGSNNPKLADTHSGTDRTNFENCLKRAARQIYSITWRKILWPDYAWFWYRPALKTAKRLCQSYRYDAIITVSHPFTGHMVGLRLKRAYPALRWITDNGDPFSVGGTVASNTQFLYQRLNRWAENAVLTSCDSISVTVDGCKTLFTEEFAIAPEKCSVVPPLLSLETNKTTGKPPFDKNGSIDLVYLGVLYPEIRRPDTVLALFASLQSRLKNCRLHFIGDVQDRHLLY